MIISTPNWFRKLVRYIWIFS